MEHLPNPLKLLDQPRSSEPAAENVATSQSSDDPCGGTGFVPMTEEARAIRKAPPGAMMRCPECAERVLQRKIERTIPARFVGCTLESFKPRDPRQGAACAEIRDRPAASFAIVGGYSRGKTHLLYAQYRWAAAVVGLDACFVRTTQELVRELQDDELERADSPILGILKKARCGQPVELHLFWDDADKLKVTDWKLEAIFGVIDGIYRHQLDLTITSNLDLSELQEKLSPAICRRVDDICTKLEL